LLVAGNKKATDEMISVEGEFESLYFHDSPVKTILFEGDEITVELGFAHILGEHR